DCRRTLHTDLRAQLILFGDRVFAGDRRYRLALLGSGHRGLAVVCTPDRAHDFCRLAVKTGAREGRVAHFDTQLVQVTDFLVQLAAVAAIHIGEYSDMGFRLFGSEDHQILARNTIDHLADGLGLDFSGQVARLPVIDGNQRALHQIFAIGTAVQYATVIQLDLIQPVDR